MKNAFSRILISGIVAAGAGLCLVPAMSAAPVNDVTITVPHEVTIGSTTLPSGTYTMSPVETGNGTEFFIVRGNNTSVFLEAQKVEGETSAKTAVTFSEEGDTWHFGKLSIAGESTEYEFSGK